MASKQPKPWKTSGYIFETRFSGKAEVVTYFDASNILVRFLGTGFTCRTTAGRLRAGNVKDLLKPTIAGVGFLGKGRYCTTSALGKKAYHCWNNMLKRCYNEANKGYSSYGARGVKVCETWHCFQNFASWFEKNYKEGFHLDKDILSDKKLYSADTCCFVPQQVNCLLLDSGATRGDHKIGVYLSSRTGKYSAYVRDHLNNKRLHLGTFDTEDEAFTAFAAKKQRVITETAQHFFDHGQITEEVRDALLIKARDFPLKYNENKNNEKALEKAEEVEMNEEVFG